VANKRKAADGKAQVSPKRAKNRAAGNFKKSHKSREAYETKHSGRGGGHQFSGGNLPAPIN
ncbi:MAG: hypothetical protein AAF410_06640, partial [Pseudomonadota bacterium]